jgi:dCTP deaminase
MILSHKDILNEIKKKSINISPFDESQVKENGIDLKIAGDWFSSEYQTDMKGSSIVIQPKQHILMTTIEKITLPVDIIGFINLKSSYARKGIIIPPTIVDAGFSGTLTIGLANLSSQDIVIAANSPVIYLVLARTETPTDLAYAGHYQNQKGITKSKI